MELAEQNSTSAPTKAKLLFVDDHQLVLDALFSMTSGQYDVRAVDSTEKAEETIKIFSPDLAILDLQMPDGSGFQAARRLLQQKPDLKLMFLSMYTDSRYIKEAMAIGALGYLSKNVRGEELMLAIQTILGGGKYVCLQTQGQNGNEPVCDLTERQTEVLRLIAQGCSAKEIATELGISVRTAEFHRAAIMDRLKLHSTAMMTRYAIERGIV
jgi:DNA-binding NarL/FixJ family response regulator